MNTDTNTRSWFYSYPGSDNCPDYGSGDDFSDQGDLGTGSYGCHSVKPKKASRSLSIEEPSFEQAFLHNGKGLSDRKTVENYKLVPNHDPNHPPSKLTRLAGAIKRVLLHIRENVDNCLNAKWLFASGVAGAVAMTGISVAAMGVVTGGISVATLLPSLMAGGSAAPVGFIGGVAGGFSLGAGYGALKGTCKGVRDLFRTPEERLVHDYESKNKQLQKLYARLERGNGKEEHERRVEFLERYLAVREEAYKEIMSGDRLA